MMPDTTVLYEKREGLAWVTLTRPRALNAINMRMRDELWDTALAVRDDPDVRVVIFKGAGERAFSAGADISEFGTAPSYVESRRARRQRDLWGLILSLQVPLIAALHRHALGAPIDAATALRYGLDQRVVPLDRLYEEAESLARTLISPAPLAMRLAKRA